MESPHVWCKYDLCEEWKAAHAKGLMREGNVSAEAGDVGRARSQWTATEKLCSRKWYSVRSDFAAKQRMNASGIKMEIDTFKNVQKV